MVFDGVVSSAERSCLALTAAKRDKNRTVGCLRKRVWGLALGPRDVEELLLEIGGKGVGWKGVEHGDGIAEGGDKASTATTPLQMAANVLFDLLRQVRLQVLGGTLQELLAVPLPGGRIRVLGGAGGHGSWLTSCAIVRASLFLGNVCCAQGLVLSTRPLPSRDKVSAPPHSRAGIPNEKRTEPLDAPPGTLLQPLAPIS